MNTVFTEINDNIILTILYKTSTLLIKHGVSVSESVSVYLGVGHSLEWYEPFKFKMCVSFGDEKQNASSIKQTFF